MKLLMTALAFVVFGMAAASCETRVDTPEAITADPGDEWEWLFDGTSLDKWRGYRMDTVPEAWTVSDSAIYCSGADAGDLMTKSEWQNFDLRLEWKISEAGNSGIMYRVMEVYDYPYLTGPEYQLLDNLGHPDAGNGTDRTTAAVYDVYAPSEDVTRPAGEWNETRILVDSTHVEHWLNGVKVVEFELFTEDWDRRIAESKWAGNSDFGRMIRGHIALQDHSDEVWFRNVRIRALPDTK